MAAAIRIDPLGRGAGRAGTLPLPFPLPTVELSELWLVFARLAAASVADPLAMNTVVSAGGVTAIVAAAGPEGTANADAPLTWPAEYVVSIQSPNAKPKSCKERKYE